MAKPPKFVGGPNATDRLWAGLSYVGLPFCLAPTLLIFLLKREESHYIYFHSLQALVGFVIGSVTFFILLQVTANINKAFPPFHYVSDVLLLVLGFGFFVVLWFYLIIMAFKGQTVRIPILSKAIESIMIH